GVEEILPKLPKNQDIVVICAKGKSSVMIGEMLAEAGLSIYYLVDGMRARSQYLEPVKDGYVAGGGELYQFVRIGKGYLSYMVVYEGEAAVIDAVRFADVFVDFAKEQGVIITNVLDTHLHADHISGGREIANKTGATYWLPPKDATEVAFEYEPLKDEDIIQVGKTEIDIQALYSPGHTIGSTSFIIDEKFL